MLDEQRDVLRALAQRRQSDREHAEPVVEILAQRFVGDRLLRIAIRRGDDPRVDLLFLARCPPAARRPSPSTRRKCGCSSTGISASSSRNSVPESARLKKPRWRRTAPVKLPFSCPNSSLPASSRDREPQFTATKWPVRPLARWIASATSSLPVPVSPSTSTGLSVRATFSICSYTACIDADSPINRPKCRRSRLAVAAPVHPRCRSEPT